MFVNGCAVSHFPHASEAVWPCPTPLLPSQQLVAGPTKGMVLVFMVVPQRHQTTLRALQEHNNSPRNPNHSGRTRQLTTPELVVVLGAWKVLPVDYGVV